MFFEQNVFSKLAFVVDDDDIDQDADVNATIKLDLSCSNIDGISLNNTSVTLIVPNNKKTWEETFTLVSTFLNLR